MSANRRPSTPPSGALVRMLTFFRRSREASVPRRSWSMDPSGQIHDPSGRPAPGTAVRRMAARPADVAQATRHRLPDNVVVRPLVRETVVLNLETGQYHGLNPTAGAILEMLGSGLSVAEVADRLAAKTGGTPPADGPAPLP